MTAFGKVLTNIEVEDIAESYDISLNVDDNGDLVWILMEYNCGNEEE